VFEEMAVGRMIRKQVYIGAEHERMLKRRAGELDVSESELIRHGIEYITRPEIGAFRDKQAWREELAFMKRIADAPSRGKTRTWTREELYEDRLNRRVPR
jgi:hypothetical protein